jgi:putative transposase
LTPWVKTGIKKVMPGRKIPLVTNEYYHVLNRGIASQPIFPSKRDYQRARETLFYYQNKTVPLKYSKFLRLATQKRAKILENLKAKGQYRVEIVCYCLMPNHVHLLLKQAINEGISKFMSDFTNSYTRYFNTKNERKGPLFEGKFKAIRIETDEQLLHLSRYIHLNPYSSYAVKSLKELESYSYSSFPEYHQKTESSFCNKEIILDQFKNSQSYKKFVFDQADYQRELEKIKHLTLEE